ncbi:DUF7507 domain-containing protein, partial [Algoriphagus limi]|nr:hypothetical protein [Algoriphagus limi]
ETYTTTYTITQADLDAGSVENTATATDGTTTGSDTETVTAEYSPSINITKTGQYEDTNSDGLYSIGDRVNYEFTVTNTGNVDLTDVSVTDLNPSVIIENGGLIGTLLIGESISISGYYELTETELITGQFINTATATGYFKGEPYTDSDDDTQSFKIVSLEIVKTAVAVNGINDPLTYSNVGDVITYTITLENTGNWPINKNQLDVVDPLATSGPVYEFSSVDENPVLQPGEIWTYSATYVITQADLDNGNFTNTVAVNVKSGSEDYEFTDDETVDAVVSPELTVIKTSDVSTYESVGDVITYTITVQNTGNVTLTDVVVSDPLTGLDELIASLAPGVTETYTTTYTITQVDLDAGSVENTATATYSYGDTEYSESDSASVTAVQGPAITITNDADRDVYSSVGEVITYT